MNGFISLVFFQYQRLKEQNFEISILITFDLLNHVQLKTFSLVKNWLEPGVGLCFFLYLGNRDSSFVSISERWHLLRLLSGEMQAQAGGVTRGLVQAQIHLYPEM